MIYRFPLPAITSISHRITVRGLLFLFFFVCSVLCLHFADPLACSFVRSRYSIVKGVALSGIFLSAATIGLVDPTHAFQYVDAFSGSLGVLAKAAVAFPLFYHFVGGVRCVGARAFACLRVITRPWLVCVCLFVLLHRLPYVPLHCRSFLPSQTHCVGLDGRVPRPAHRAPHVAGRVGRRRRTDSRLAAAVIACWVGKQKKRRRRRAPS
jgi:succinate dehydrogenase/fumarate reductase cytochrome b subunit